jgi:hypothetical protein
MEETRDQYQRLIQRFMVEFGCAPETDDDDAAEGKQNDGGGEDDFGKTRTIYKVVIIVLLVVLLVAISIKYGRRHGFKIGTRGWFKLLDIAVFLALLIFF